MLRALNTGHTSTVKTKYGLGGAAVAWRWPLPDDGGSPERKQEENKTNTRGTQESTSQSPGLHLARTWLEVGFGRLCPTLLHSPFCILLSPRVACGWVA